MSQNKGRLFMFFAVLLAAAAALVGYVSLQQMAERLAAGQGRNFRPVVVAASELTYGVKLERPMLRVVSYPKDAVPDGAYADPDSVVNQTTKVFLGAREPVTASKLSSRGGGLSMLVRKNMRAASLQVNQVSGVSGFVLPGDRVDVLATVDSHSSTEEAVTRTVLQNVEVLAAGQKTEQRDNKPITVQAVTVLVDPEGAEVLAHAQHEGEIALVLRNPDDQDKVQLSALSTGRMLGNAPIAAAPSGPRAHVVRTRPASAPVAVARSAEKPKVRIIRSANVTETPAVTDTTAN